MDLSFRIIVWLVLLAVAAVLVAQNAQVVELRFLFWRLAMSQALLILFVLAAGIVIGWILHVLVAWRRARREQDISGPRG